MSADTFSVDKEGRTVQHSAVGIVTVRTEPPVGDDLDFENRRPLESMPPPPRRNKFVCRGHATGTLVSLIFLLRQSPSFFVVF